LTKRRVGPQELPGALNPKARADQAQEKGGRENKDKGSVKRGEKTRAGFTRKKQKRGRQGREPLQRGEGIKLNKNREKTSLPAMEDREIAKESRGNSPFLACKEKHLNEKRPSGGRKGVLDPATLTRGPLKNLEGRKLAEENGQGAFASVNRSGKGEYEN